MFWRRSFVVHAILLSQVCARYRDNSPTTKTYDIEVPGSAPIRVVEDESSWDDSETITPRYRSRFSLDESTTITSASSIKEVDDGKTTQDPTEALKDFLHRYSEKVRKKGASNSAEKRMEEVPLILKNDEEPKNRLANLYLDDEEKDRFNAKSKGWDLLHLERHHHQHQHQHHPFADHRKGWVSLEAVPWSVSKISKWHSNQPIQPDYGGDIDRNYNVNVNVQKPLASGYDYNSRPSPVSTSSYERPSSSTLYHSQSHKVHVNNNRYHSKFPEHPHKHSENCHHKDEEQDIITDGLPPNFPSSSYNRQDFNRRRGTSHEVLQETHPFNGDGEWVLLSTTKGYKHPKKRERSMQELGNDRDNNNDSVSTHRSVRLTVLPPLKSSKVNMTTSHGGLLQVESTFQTVEQAQKAFAKKQRLKNRNKISTTSTMRTTKTTKKPSRRVVKRKQKRPAQVLSAMTKPTMTSPQVSDTSAVLAAVGAGMIPATMAMLVPMAMSGRKRRRRSVLDVEGFSEVDHVTRPTLKFVH